MPQKKKILQNPILPTKISSLEASEVDVLHVFKVNQILGVFEVKMYSKLNLEFNNEMKEDNEAKRQA